MALQQIHSRKEALAILRAEAGFDPLATAYGMCAYDVAVRCARYLMLDKFERRARDKGVAEALALIPEDTYGLQGVFRYVWDRSQAVLTAKNKQKTICLDELAKELAPMRKVGVVPRPQSGVDHGTLPVRMFIFTLTYLRRADSRPDLSPWHLYLLCYGLDLVKPYAVNDYGLPRLSHWRRLVNEVLALEFTPSMRDGFPTEAYYLAASVSECMGTYEMTEPPTRAALAEYVRVSEHLHTHPAFPSYATA